MSGAPAAATERPAAFAGPEPAAPARPIAERAWAPVARLTAGLAAAIVAVEVVLLLASVVARYGLNRPIVWADELASLLFLWLAMLGSAVALDRGEHMRLTIFVKRLPARLQDQAETLALALTLAFLVALLPYAVEHVIDEIPITTPALGLSNAWRAAALVVGAVLMVGIGLVRLLSSPALRGGLAAVLPALAVLGAVLLLSRPLIVGIGNANLVLFFVVISMSSVLAGVPIAVAFGVSTLSYLTLVTDVPLTIVVNRMDEGMGHLILLSIPLFVLLGLLIVMTGMARAMVDFLASLLGHLRGGLSYVLLGAMYLVSGIAGAKAADMAAVAPVLFPEMKKRGAKPGELVSLLAASGAMSETIPPSLVLIAIGSVAGISIAALFTGGLLPALLLALALATLCFFRSRGEDLSHVRRATRAEILRLLLWAAPALILPFVIRTAVVEGVATATEVSTIGVAYSVLVGLLVYRSFNWRRVGPMLVETASLSGSIMLIIGTATAMAWALTQSGFSRDLAGLVSAVPGGVVGFMLISIAIFVVLGSILEGIPAIVLLGPLMFPVARGLGIHDVHYAMVVILAMGVGLFAPPFGVGYYVACAIGRIDPQEGTRAIWPYLGVLLIGVLIVAAVPWISIGFL